MGTWLIILMSLILVAGSAYYFIYEQPRNEFKNKTYWAVCGDNQGMMTHEVYLYNDSTFFMDDGIVPECGEYNVQNDRLYFSESMYGDSKEFIFTTDNSFGSDTRLLPVRGYEPWFFYRSNGIGAGERK